MCQWKVEKKERRQFEGSRQQEAKEVSTKMIVDDRRADTRLKLDKTTRITTLNLSLIK